MKAPSGDKDIFDDLVDESDEDPDDRKRMGRPSETKSSTFLTEAVSSSVSSTSSVNLVQNPAIRKVEIVQDQKEEKYCDSDHESQRSGVSEASFKRIPIRQIDSDDEDEVKTDILPLEKPSISAHTANVTVASGSFEELD